MAGIRGSVQAALIPAITLLVASGCVAPAHWSTAAGVDTAFVLLPNDLVVDRHSKLMWPARDNGRDISFEQAQAYVKESQLAGYRDWRLPTLQEIEQKGKSKRH